MSDEPKEESISECTVHVAESSCGGDPDAMAKMMRSMHGPQAVDQALRSAVSTCWMMLPEDKKNVDSVEREVRRIIDRIIADLHEDAEVFGYTCMMYFISRTVSSVGFSNIPLRFLTHSKRSSSCALNSSSTSLHETTIFSSISRSSSSQKAGKT